MPWIVGVGAVMAAFAAGFFLGHVDAIKRWDRWYAVESARQQRTPRKGGRASMTHWDP